jgi:hypothetical protein
MNHYQIVIVWLLISQAVTLALLWETAKNGDKWRVLWTRDSAELLFWKRNAVLRDPLTGKYRKKDKRT